ncbi:MAG TPA: hypothetical protein ENN80_03030 [Candidatus Hydrogenedentes bacterium]|nr:hypothetical protein [Candidatus Hydrogenedentota bacterium]
MKVLTHLESEELTRHLVRGVVLAGGTGALKNYPSLSETLFHVPCQVGLPDTVEFPHRAIYTPEFTAIAGILRHGFAYRDAVRRGGLDARTPVHGGLRGLLELIRRYFF